MAMSFLLRPWPPDDMNISLSSASSLSSSATTATSSSANPPTATTTSTSWFSAIVRGRSDGYGSVNMSGGSIVADSSGPIMVKNQFRGLLFNYGPKPVQVACKTGDYKQQVIFIGGLTDGFLATEYLEPLPIALDKEKWSLVPVLLSSSYAGYGISSLQQDIVHYMRANAACSRAVRAAILQVIFSMAYQYVPEYVDKKALVDRLCRALGGAEKVKIEHGNHSLSNRLHEAVRAIVDFVKREGPSGWDDPWN